MSTEILDLDSLVPDAKPVSFTDRQGVKHNFDVAFIPFEAGLIVIDRLPSLLALGGNPSAIKKEDFDLIIKLVSDICIQTDDTLTPEFLKKNLSLTQAVKLLEVAMESIGRFVSSNQNGGGQGGKKEFIKK